jgi:Txe/YoeB family toxin of Txe-Axe toxin-antitoxin module
METKEKFYKQINYLLNNIRHPSLHAKKYDESLGIWQARVNTKIRFYFLIENDSYILLDIKNHPK